MLDGDLFRYLIDGVVLFQTVTLGVGTVVMIAGRDSTLRTRGVLLGASVFVAVAVVVDDVVVVGTLGDGLLTNAGTGPLTVVVVTVFVVDVFVIVVVEPSGLVCVVTKTPCVGPSGFFGVD